MRRALPQAVGASTEHVRFMDWNFLERPLAELPAALQSAGLSPALPSVVTWCGAAARAMPSFFACFHSQLPMALLAGRA